MGSRNTKLDVSTFKRIYSGVYAAFERTNLLYGAEFYLAGQTSGPAEPVKTELTDSAVEIFILVKSDHQWKDLICHLTKKEMFYQAEKNTNEFYRRGSRIRLTAVQKLNDGIDKSLKLS